MRSHTITILLTLLLACLPCLAADRYVNSAAAGGGDGTVGTPWNTIAAAFAGSGDGDTIHCTGSFGEALIYNAAKSLTFTGDGTPWTWARGATASVLINVTADATTKTLTVEDMTYGGGATSAVFLCAQNAGISIHLEDCVIVGTATEGLATVNDYAAKPVARSFTADNCTLTSAKEDPIIVKDVGLVRLSDCAITYTYSAGSGGNGLDVYSTVKTIVVEDCTISFGSNFLKGTATRIDAIRVEGNTVTWTPCANSTSFVYLIPANNVSTCLIKSNTITIATSAFIPTAIYCGQGVDDSPYTSTLNGLAVVGNTISHARTGYYGTAIAAGCWVTGGSIVNNNLTGFGWGVATYGARNLLIAGNAIRASNPFVLNGGGGHTIRGNTAVSVAGLSDTSGRALVFSRTTWGATDATTPTITYAATTITDGGSNPWGDAAGLADIDQAITRMEGKRTLLVLAGGGVGASADPTHWAELVSRSGNEITVDYWRKVSDGSTETPANDTTAVIVEFCERTSVFDNILDASRAAYTLTHDFNPRDGLNFVDFNCYGPTAGTTSFSNLGEATQANLTAVQAKWLTWSAAFPLNDANSYMAEPGYNYDAGSFALPLGSPCIDRGTTPAITGSKHDSGAYQQPFNRRRPL